MSAQSSLLEAILEANDYMTLATADGDGLPWATPVWFATADRREFLWVSSPQARHSRNIAVRREVGIVVFDSRQAPGGSGGVYLSAIAERVPEGDLDRAIAVFSTVSEAKGLRAWTRADIEGRLRLYRATALERFVLSDVDTRIPVPA
jgi:pyridoxine/pyridoxamine 5'-phosphate oxidase